MPKHNLVRAMDRADYALLNAVVDGAWAAYLLAGDAPMENIMNKPSHGLEAVDLAKHFFRLWEGGLIECRIDESGSVALPDFDLTRHQFVRSEEWPPARDRCLIYRLSATGANVWESLASPDWSKFLNSSTGDDPKEYTTCEDQHFS
jgi:hypothetical protein